MANTKSAKKRAEKSEAQRAKNRAVRSTMRTAIKKFRAAAAAGDEKAGELLARTVKVIDSTAQKGIIHKNTAARTKSRLSKTLQQTAR